MNNHKNYNSGFRKELLTISLACGFVPFKCLALLNPNRTSIQHIVSLFVEDGDFEKYHNKEIWFIAPTKKMRDRIFLSPDQKESLSKKFPEALKDYYNNYALVDCYKAKSTDKKYETRRLRSLRNAEAFTFFYSVGFDTLPGEKKTLKELTMKEDLKNTTFFPFRELTGVNPDISFDESAYADAVEKINPALSPTEKKKEKKKNASEAINLTKVNGIVTLTNSEATYTVINTGKTLDPYKENGERKALIYINNILATTSLPQISGCILLYPSDAPLKKIAYPQLERKEKEKVNALCRAYNGIKMYAVPLTPDGQTLIKIMNTPMWEERLTTMTIKKEWRTDDNSYVNFDGKNYDEKKKKTCYHFNFLIPNVAKLTAFLSYVGSSIGIEDSEYYIYCYDFQKKFLEEIAPPQIEIRAIPMSFIKDKFKNVFPQMFRED